MTHVPLNVPFVGSRPKIPIMIRTKAGTYISQEFLIDTGADKTTMGMDFVVKSLGYTQKEIESGKKVIVAGSTGNVSGYSYFLSTSIKINATQPAFNLEAVIQPNYPASLPFLVGRQGLLDNYTVIFDKNQLIFRAKHAGPNPPAIVVPPTGSGLVPTPSNTPGSVPRDSPTPPRITLPPAPLVFQIGNITLSDRQVIIAGTGFLILVAILESMGT